MRSTREQMGMTMKIVDGEVITYKDVKKRWSKYSEPLKNVSDDREAEVVCLEQSGMRSD